MIALGTGLQVTRGVRLGLTLNKWGNGYRQHTVRTVARRGTNDVDFQFDGFNLNLGVIWSPIESLNVAAVGKTPFTGDVTMSKTRTDLAVDLPDASDDTTADRITTNSYSASNITVDIPGALGAGVSWRPMAPDDLFPVLPFPTLDPTRTQTDSDQFRVGAEYVMLFKRLKWPLRAGYFNDGQFFRTASGSAPRLNGVAAGTGLIVGPVLLDVAYNFESGTYSDSALDTTTGDVTLQEKSRTFHRLFVSIIYRHGGRP